VEIYQNCPIFNDDAFDAIKDNESKADAIIPLVHGEPILFGKDRQKGVVRDQATGGVKIVDDPDLADVLVHDAHAPDPTTAFAISRLTDSGVLKHAPIGIFRQVEAATYDDLAREQISTASQGTPEPAGALAGLLSSGDTWTVV
jgi:2-oxoglutarate/2-oxoacid ferredoxin oxidoreductase subunit beta